MPAFEPTLQNWRHYPPPGGWSVVYQPHDRPQSAPFQAQGNSPQDVLDHIRRWRANNGLPMQDAAVFDYCNTIWCMRAPERCTHPTPPPADPPAGAGRRTLTPVDYGPGCWLFLNTFGVSFNPVLFQQALHQVVSLLSPHNPHNNGSGCVVCHSHFEQHLAAYPPTKVQSAEQAAVWVWLAHDAANVFAGKAHRPTFRSSAAKFGWPMLSQEEFYNIQRSLMNNVAP